MAEADSVNTMTIDALYRLASISFYDLARVPPGTRMFVEQNWRRDDVNMRWDNEKDGAEA